MPKLTKDISIIIVNYNVAYFLEQCLHSVYKALEDVSSEVFVVDNNSIDNSVDVVKEKFPEVHLIENKFNVGFSKANNQAIEISKGRYVLLLNPDTVVEEDTFKKVLDFMDSHPDAGGLGVHMVDGSGTFLPESKRGLPTPSVAFYKIFGLSKLFPKSRKFAKYHLSYLSEFETNEVDILSGAFMLMRKETLEKVGLLDETFFMYGEDIDLSYRIQLGGYKNYYFANTNIIHYKGESTKKSSVNYVFVFYQAMVIFAEKHFSKENAKLFSFLINLAIYLRAGAAIIVRFIQKSVLPIIDISSLLVLFYYLGQLWEQNQVKFPIEVIQISYPAYICIWLISLLYSGAYDREIKISKILKGGCIGTVVILMIYALLPKHFQFSRLYILLAFGITVGYFIFSRIIFSLVISKRFSLFKSRTKKFAIVGSIEETVRIEKILNQYYSENHSVFHISENELKTKEQVGNINQLEELKNLYRINEIIFSSKDVTAQTIISWMNQLSGQNVLFKIAQPDSTYLIGSNSSDSNGEYYTIDNQNITQENAKRNKRTFDFISSLFLIIISPFLIVKYKHKKQFLLNIFHVLIGKKTFIGYDLNGSITNQQLPKIKKGIIQVSNEQSQIQTKSILLYVKNYTLKLDIDLLLKNIKYLDKI